MKAIDQPRISICIPAYNQTIYLARLLDSIATQQFTDFEIIISDDSVTEDVSQLITKYNFGNKLKYFGNKKSLGSPANWNAAIEKATGKYIKIMHHDDAFTGENVLSDMISFIETNEFDYIFCNTKIENVKYPGKNRIHTIRKLSRTIKKPYLLFFGNSIGSPSTLLIKKDRFPGLQYDPGYIWLVDMEYYARLFTISSNGAAIPEPLILTHASAENQLTALCLEDFELQIKEQAMLYDAFVNEVPRVTKFFMQVSVARLFFKGRITNKDLANRFSPVPGLLRFYFSSLKFKPLYFAYYIFIRISDLLRKILFY